MMKSFPVALLFCVCISFSFALPDTRARAKDESERKIWAECNATNPVRRNVFEQIEFSVLANDRSNLTHAEKCFVLCVLQKGNEFDQDGNYIISANNIKSIHEIQTVKLSDVAIASSYQINRLYKDIPDKCEKAALIFEQLQVRFFELAVYQQLADIIYVGDKLANDGALQQVKPFLEKFDQTIVSTARKQLEKINAGSSKNIRS